MGSSFWLAAHGAASLFIGIGLARFSFTPLIPLLIRDGWYEADEAQLLGAWALAGYLLGGLASQRLAYLTEPHRLSILMSACVVLSLLICAYPVAYPIAAFWRFASGFAGAVLMIAGAAETSARLSQIGAPRLAGVMFTGIGAGAAVGALLTTVFKTVPVDRLCAVLAAIAMASFLLQGWAGRRSPPRRTPHERQAAPRTAPKAERAILWILAAYGLDAVGVTPHAVYMVDYATREAGLAAEWAGLAWGAFGLGAICGPLVLMGRSRRLLWPFLLLKAVAVGAIAMTDWPPAWVASGFVVGFCTPGVAVLITSFIRAAAGPESFIRYWAWATVAFALMQMAGGFMAASLSQTLESYAPVFALASASLFLGAAAAMAGGRVLDREASDRRSEGS